MTERDSESKKGKKNIYTWLNVCNISFLRFWARFFGDTCSFFWSLWCVSKRQSSHARRRSRLKDVAFYYYCCCWSIFLLYMYNGNGTDPISKKLLFCTHVTHKFQFNTHNSLLFCRNEGESWKTDDDYDDGKENNDNNKKDFRRHMETVNQTHEKLL